jgi:hypothetical protein
LIAITPRAANPRHPQLLLVRLAIAALFLAAIAGCGDDNPVNPKLQAKYLDSSTPQNVLTNLVRAYTSRDSAGCDSLFDAAYAGISIDNNDPAPALTFTKADEMLHIGALARTATITSVSLTFGPNPIRYTDSGDSAGWASVQTTTPALILVDGPNAFFTGASEFMMFKFRPTTPASGSPTDTTWKIVRWSEIAN